MPPRKVQQVLGTDPNYSRSFPGSVTPAEQPSSPEPQPPAQASARPQPPRPLEPPALPQVAVMPALTTKPRAPAARQPEPSAVERLPRRSKKSKLPKPSTERVTVWVRPLLSQEDRIAATNLPPQDVLKAAWRKAAARYSLGATYVKPSQAERAEGRDYCYATTLRLDADTLQAMRRVHDRLGIMGSWSLIRGQVEPLFWEALDELLTTLEGADGASAEGS